MTAGFDVVVVGGGITGCLAARRLASGGATVALLEAGPDPAAALFHQREPPRREQQPVQSQLYLYSDQTARYLVSDVEHPYSVEHDAPFLWFRGRQLGGRMHLWDGCCPRLTEAQLGGDRDDPAGWPLTYQELAGYYLEAERELKVRTLPAGPLEQRVLRLVAREFAEARSILRPIAELRFAELRKDLAALPTLTILTEAIVEELGCNSTPQRIDTVRYVDGRSRERKALHARVVVLCASTLETTRILLNSRNRDHPFGLGNSSGVLGRYLMDHTSGIFFGGKPIPTPAPSNGLCVYRDVGGGRRRYGLEAQFASSADGGSFWIAAFGEVDPAPTNRVTLDPDRRDCWGIPILRIRLQYSQQDRARMQDAAGFCETLLQIAGLRAEPDWTSRAIADPGASIHEVGTARMGSDPGNSFLNKFNQSWDVANLFVTDGAAFPRSSHPNPTLTMAALTLRACDTILPGLRRPAGITELV